MPKYEVTQTDTSVEYYEVEAEDEYEAEQKVLSGEAEHIVEKDEVVSRTFGFEEIPED
jgi:hypothetical protein